MGVLRPGLGSSRPKSKGRLAVVLLAALALFVSAPVAPTAAHDSENDGHIPPNVNYGFTVRGRNVLKGVTDGKYTDVWTHKGYAYVGSFETPDCDTDGVYVVNIADTIADYDAGIEPDPSDLIQIQSPVATRVNDIKAITIGNTEVLITTEEPCDTGGSGGISLWDVTDPTTPTPLKESFQQFSGGVHNTFPWRASNGRTYLIGVANTFDGKDVPLYDITDPANPSYLGSTGYADWVADGDITDGQFETGSYPILNNHDISVENINGRDMAVVSYWDLGFVTLDVTTPRNPVFVADSTYPEETPIDSPYEGNAHAAVFGSGGDTDIIVAGDEDFDPISYGVTFNGAEYLSAPAAYGSSDLSGLDGQIVWTNSNGCTQQTISPATAANQIALFEFDSCQYGLKGLNAQRRGYAGYVVSGYDQFVFTMTAGVYGDQVSIPGLYVPQATGQLFKAGGSISNVSLMPFDGWGYLRILNNRMVNNVGASVNVPSEAPGPTPTISVGHMGEVGYYAPAEVFEAPEGAVDYEDYTEFGDLTMHNVEQDPTTVDVTPSFDAGPRFFVSWYSLGMRAIEYRPGHFHDNSNEEGSYSWNVHEVGRFIAEDGSNFWGVHVDDVVLEEGGEAEQFIFASDRNTGLWIFSFGCQNRDEVEGPFYCENSTDGDGDGEVVCYPGMALQSPQSPASLYFWRAEGPVDVGAVNVPSSVTVPGDPGDLYVQIRVSGAWIDAADVSTISTTAGSVTFDPVLRDVQGISVGGVTGIYAGSEVCNSAS